MNYRMGELSIEITHNCSLNCKFCSSSAKCLYCSEDNSDDPQRELSLSTIKNLLVEGRKNGAVDFSISGGEPFVHPNFWEILDYAETLGYNLLLYTSGSLFYNGKATIEPIDSGVARRLNQYKSMRIIFDTQGCEEKKVDNLMGRDGAFENIVESIRNCVKEGLTVESHFVPMRPNFKHLLETVDFLEDLGVSKVSFLRWVPQGRSAEEPSRWAITKKQFRDLQYILIALEEERRKIKIRAGHPIDFRFLIDSKYPIRRCRGGGNAPLIQPLPDGRPLLVMCPAFKDLKHYAAGIVYNGHNLGDLWKDSKTYRIFRWFIHDEGYKSALGACAECPWLYRCRGGCTAARLLHNTSSTLPLEEAIRMTPDPMCFWEGI